MKKLEALGREKTLVVEGDELKPFHSLPWAGSNLYT